MVKKAIVLFIFFLINVPIYAANAHYTADNIFSFTRVDYVTVSPNGKQIAYVTWARDPEDKNKLRYALNLKEENGNTSEVTHAVSISSVSWSPDGNEIAFISPNQSGNEVISIYHLSNKSISTLLTLSRGIVGLRWVPSGKQIAFIAEDDLKTSNTHGFKLYPSPIINLRLYLIDVNKPDVISALTPANYSISYDPFTRGFSFSPDSNKIAFAYQPSSKAVDDIQPKVAILDLTTQKITTLSYCQQHTCRQPLFSPDGKWLAFTANIPTGNTAKNKALLDDIEIRNHICLQDKAGQVHCLKNTYNTNPWLLAWNAESSGVYVIEPYKSHGINIYMLSKDKNAPVALISNQGDFIEPLTLTLNETKTTFGFGYETVNQASEVYISPSNSFHLQQITHLNETSNKPLGTANVISWKSKDGTPVEGLFITPPDYNSAHSYPLYVDVHGGPSGAQAKRYIGFCDEYGAEGFAPTTCPAHILSLGYVVLQVNYRGSSGYGLNFRIKNFADLGGGDFQDIMTGIDYVIQHFNINQHRIAIAGWSYGGYMSAWAISHTNRFSVAIDGDGITDFYSYSSTSDDTDFGLRYLGKNFWENHQLYWKHSPMSYITRIYTPLLIIHGEKDIRVPLSQGKELFTGLTLLNRPVTMFTAPNQSHEPGDIETFSQELNTIDQTLLQH